ncbi:hypothetical protein D3C72_846880 [compost metagenome]
MPEHDAMFGAQRRLFLQLERPDFLRLEQGDHDVQRCALPGRHLLAQLVTAARACHQAQPMRRYVADPVDGGLEHGLRTLQPIDQPHRPQVKTIAVLCAMLSRADSYSSSHDSISR